MLLASESSSSLVFREPISLDVGCWVCVCLLSLCRECVRDPKAKETRTINGVFKPLLLLLPSAAAAVVASVVALSVPCVRNLTASSVPLTFMAATEQRREGGQRRERDGAKLTHMCILCSRKN